MPRLLTVVVLVLAFPAIADAKERHAQICGRGGCVEITDVQLLQQLPLGEVAAPPAERFFVLSLTVSAGRTVPEYLTMYYVRSKRLLAANGATAGSLTWFPLTEQAIEALELATAGLDPFLQPSAWPAELKSPARVGPRGDAASSEPGARGFDWPLVSGSLLVALALALTALLLGRRFRHALPRAA